MQIHTYAYVHIIVCKLTDFNYVLNFMLATYGRFSEVTHMHAYVHKKDSAGLSYALSDQTDKILKIQN
jgi:hypothetical protein